MYKPLADSTLMGMSKKEIIELLRVAEHNHQVCEEQINQQYINCQKLLKQAKADGIREFAERLKEKIDMRIFTNDECRKTALSKHNFDSVKYFQTLNFEDENALSYIDELLAEMEESND